jgi:ArsR family transcriptional regulator
MFFMVQLSTRFAALADPTRLRLLHLLQAGEICVCFLQEVLQTNQPKISRHLAYLKRAGLVDARRDGKWMHYKIKKQSAEVTRILNEALRQVAREPEARRDMAKLKKLQCPSAGSISPAPIDQAGRQRKAVRA